MKLNAIPIKRALNKAFRKEKVLEYIFEFPDAYDFSSEGSEAIQEEPPPEAENSPASPVCYANAPELRGEYRQ